MAEITMNQLRKVYPNGYVGVEGATLTIPDGEFCVLVGPSGSGKTTLLRMIAGLEEISSGDLSIDARRVNDLPPKDRDIAMVFQNYALYPHMTIYENMAFGLRLRGIPKDEIDKRVQEAAKFLYLEDRLENRPKQLSGGQRQRVAVGRAIVRKPKVFLFDEPLSNLDAKLRVEMRVELARLHRKLNATIVYVTHDQVEAMTLASRIIVLDKGRIQQVGSPLELYANPVNLFVAGFIGSPSMNFLNVTISAHGDHVHVTNPGLSIRLTADQAARVKERGLVGREARFGIRPEHIGDRLFEADAPADMTFKAIVDVVEPMGAETYAYVRVQDQTVVVRMRGDRDLPKVGSPIELVCDMGHAHLFDKASGDKIA